MAFFGFEIWKPENISLGQKLGIENASFETQLKWNLKTLILDCWLKYDVNLRFEIRINIRVQTQKWESEFQVYFNRPLVFMIDLHKLRFYNRLSLDTSINQYQCSCSCSCNGMAYSFACIKTWIDLSPNQSAPNVLVLKSGFVCYPENNRVPEKDRVENFHGWNLRKNWVSRL